MNSAKKLLQFNFDADDFTRCALKPIEIPSERFAVLKKIMKDHDGKGPEAPNHETLREIYHLFIGTSPSRLSTEFDSLRRIRHLAWVLTYSEAEFPCIVDTSRLQEALQLIENRFRISTLRAVFEALLEAWDSPNASMLRAFVSKHLKDYNGKQEFFQKLRTNIAWYCEENSATQLATALLRSKKKLSDVWSFLDLRDYMNTYPYFGSVAMAYVSISSPRDKAFVENVVEFVKKYKNDTKNRAILSNLIEQLGNDASEDLRQPIQSYVLQKWGDPRLAGSNWREVSNEARQIFTRWITKEDLRFFFDAVARACDDQNFEYRREFWLAYLEHINFCRPVLRRNAESLFRHDPQTLQYYRDRRPATLRGGNRDQHAFIIQMRSYTFVEFSTAGACYVYHNVDLPFELGRSEYHMNELRNQDWAVHRVIHQNSENYYWQKNFTDWIKNEIGIEPLRSYRLDSEDEVDNGQKLEDADKIRINCPNERCRQQLRIPVTEGRLKITCPRCQTTFQYQIG